MFIGPQTSVGNMYLGPYYYYFIAPALWLGNYNPLGPAIFVTLLGILTIYLTFIIVKKWFNPHIAYISAFLYAISPVTVKYSTFSWNPNIMPLFALLFVYFFFNAIFDKKYNHFIWAMLCFIMCLNSHYLALLLLVFSGAYWLFTYKKAYLKPTLIAFIILFISFTPQILFDLKHRGQNIGALTTFFTKRETTVSVKAYKALPKMFPLFDQITNSMFLGNIKQYPNIFSIIFLVLLIYIIVKKRQSKYFWLIFFWNTSALIGLGLYKHHIYDHYYGIIYISLIILLSIIIYEIKYFGYLLLLLLTYFSTINSNFFKIPQNQIQHAKVLAQSIRNDASNSSTKYNITMLGAYNDFRAQAIRYFLETNNPNLLGQENYPEADILYISYEDPSRWPLKEKTDIWEIQSLGKLKIDKEYKSADQTTIIKLVKEKNEK